MDPNKTYFTDKLSKWIGWIDFKAVMILMILLFQINNMAHFNNLRFNALVTSEKVERIGIHVGAIEPEDEDDF